MNNNYTIKYGDTLSGIALKNGTTVSALMSANPTIKNADKIGAGVSIVLPQSQNNIQNTTQQRVADTKAQADYSNLMTAKGLNGANATPSPTGGSAGTATNGATTTAGNTQGQDPNQKASNLNGLVDSLYLQGTTDPAKILSQSNGQLDLDTINKRLETLNADPTYKANAGIMTEYQKNIKSLDDQKAQLDTQFEALKLNMEAENKSAVESIQSNFALRREQLKSANEALRGSREKMGYQTDSFRYTPTQMNGLITNDEQNYVTNLAELDAQEKQLLLQASSAKAKGDWDFLSKSMDAYNAINDNRKSVLGEMLRISVENNKKLTADNKIEQLSASQRGTQADNIAESAMNAVAGLTGQERQNKLQEIAKEYKIDVRELESSVLKSETTAKKQGLDIANKQKTLDKVSAVKAPAKTTTKTTKTTKPTVAQSIELDIGDAVSQIKEIMKTNSWRGVNPDDYAEAYNYFITTYGYSSAKKFKQALEDEGILVDN